MYPKRYLIALASVALAAAPLSTAQVAPPQAPQAPVPVQGEAQQQQPVQQQPPAQQAPEQAPAVPPAAEEAVAEMPSDAEIAQHIQTRLQRDPAVTADNLRVEVAEGVAVVRGEVPHLLEAERAMRLAEGVRGVTQVMTDIQVGVEEERRSDEELREDVLQALQEDAATGRYDLEVTARDGRVTVAGSVASREELNLVRRVARDVEGVESVNHAITIGYALSGSTQRGVEQTTEEEPEQAESGEERSDEQIADDIRRRLEWDAYVDARRIEVSVENGEVTLSGNVISPAERTNAVYRAWVRGVEAVDGDALEVAPGAAMEPVDRPRAPRTDDEIREAVERSIRETARVSPFEIEVQVEDGVVTLIGAVDHVEARREAGDAARRVSGVLHVEDTITVVAGDTRTEDEQLRTAARAALMRNPHLSRANIDVDVIDGVASLTGEVESTYARALADNAVGRVRGILDVENRLEVAPETAQLEAHLHDPIVRQFDYSRYGWWRDRTRPARPLRSDADILRDVQNNILWSPHLSGREMTVYVEEGVVTLSGTVSNETARRLAHVSALEGGALSVVDNLTVRTEVAVQQQTLEEFR